MTYYDIYDVLGCGGLRTQQVSHDNIKTNAHKTENNTKCKEAFGDTVGVDILGQSLSLRTKLHRYEIEMK